MLLSRIASPEDSGSLPNPDAQPAFRLLHYFSIASLITIVAATVLLTALQQRLAVRDLIRAQEEQNIVLTQSVARGHHDLFSELIGSAARLDADSLRAHPQVARMQQLIQGEFAGSTVLKVKIYDQTGRTVFSSDPLQIGEDKSANAGFQKARDGQAASELTHRNEFSAFEQKVENVDLVSSYVPIRARDGNAVEAVFEIYSDTSPLLSQIRNTRNTVALQVTAVLIALYLALFFIVRHADRVIRVQDARRRRDEEKLQEARQAVARSEKFHRALIEKSSDAVMLLGGDLRIRYSAPANSRVLGIPEERIFDIALPEFVNEPYREPVASWLVSASAAPGQVQRVEFEARHEALGDRYFVATATNLCDQPDVGGIIVNIRDYTERRRAELEVQQHARFDGLTGLARREFFVQQMRKTIGRASRNNEVLALMFMDLDGFKSVNDTLGHDIGDLLLKEVSARIRSVLRQDDEIGRGDSVGEEQDRAARLGGDEFTVLLGGLDQPASAALVAERMLAAISAPYVFGEVVARVTSSIGIAVYADDGLTCEELMKKADAAMYTAKQQGKNTFCFATEPRPRRTEPSLSLVQSRQP